MTGQLATENRLLLISESDTFEVYRSLESDIYPTEILPKELTLREIGSLGISIANIAERINPSRDGIRNGRRAEVRYIGNMSIISRFHGDCVTSDNSLEHLKSLGLMGRYVSLVNGFTINMSSKTSLSGSY
jgi:hypothetical protein